ncbi:MAG: hypothetical protein JW839_10915 [Candidatus Lokiarchaeota archaeon]|nr:hypothetical protein [Candidatus Lokiarchaeota archaeon]
MGTHSSIAVSPKLRKTIKKIAAFLDVSQGEVVEKAITVFENTLISSANVGLMSNNASKTRVQKIMEQATKDVWKDDPERERVQRALMQGSGTIDDVIISDWRTGIREIDGED